MATKIAPAVVALVCAAANGSAQTFVDRTAAANLVIPTADCLDSRGAATADFDGDGDLDIVVPGYQSGVFRYFQNDGTGAFVDSTATANLGPSDLAHCFACGDIDNDGDQDLFVGGAGPDKLFLNDGSGVFTEVASQFGVGSPSDTYGATFGDYDRDGDLDLYLAVHNYATNLLFRNEGGAGFTDVTVSAGLQYFDEHSFVAFWIDYDEDGWLDLYTINTKGMISTPNRMLRNNGDGTFSDIGVAVGAQIGIDGMGGDFADVFNDGGSDIYATDVPPDHVFLVWDAAAGVFTHEQATFGLDGGWIGWACHFVDFDNDAWPDLYVVNEGYTNQLFRNPAQPVGAATPWSDVTAAWSIGGVATRGQHSVCVGDFDEDGRQDVLEVFADGPNPNPGIVLRQNLVPAGNWLRVDTVGTVSNRDGQGAKLRLTAGGVTQYQCVRSGVGFMSASDTRVHFGLGASTVADRLEIEWPSGQVQVLSNVVANQNLSVVEPSFRHVGALALGSTSSLEMQSRFDAGLGFAIAVSLDGTPTSLPSGRVIPIGFDDVTAAALMPGNPLTPTPVGFLDSLGAAQTSFILPNDANLSGLVVHATALSLDAGAPEAIRTILPALRLVLP